MKGDLQRRVLSYESGWLYKANYRVGRTVREGNVLGIVLKGFGRVGSFHGKLVRSRLSRL